VRQEEDFLQDQEQRPQHRVLRLELQKSVRALQPVVVLVHHGDVHLFEPELRRRLELDHGHLGLENVFGLAEHVAMLCPLQ